MMADTLEDNRYEQEYDPHNNNHSVQWNEKEIDTQIVESEKTVHDVNILGTALKCDYGICLYNENQYNIN